jgi:phosphate transport system substrate-binding protein
METMARGLIEAYRTAYPQETPFQITLSLADEIRNDLDQGRVSAVLQWNPASPEDWTAAIGWTGIVFIVNPKNSVDNLSRDQARDIYLGLIDRWEDVGGPAGDIHRLAYAPDQDLENLFQGIVLASGRTANGFQAVPAPYAMIEEIRKDEFSIGYLPGFNFSREVRPITVDHVTAEYGNLLSEKYPFRVPVYLISKDPVPAAVYQFAGWAQSVEGQSVFLTMQSWE